MPMTVSERKLHAIELITKLADDRMLALVETLLSAHTNAYWIRLLAQAASLDSSIHSNTLTEEEIMKEVNEVRQERNETR